MLTPRYPVNHGIAGADFRTVSHSPVLAGLSLAIVFSDAPSAPTYYVRAKLSGRDVLLAIDSAFNRTAIFETTPKPRGGHSTVVLGGHYFEFDNHPAHPQVPVQGVPVVGSLGSDVLMSGTVVLDPMARRLDIRELSAKEQTGTRWSSFPVAPTNAGFWYSDLIVDGTRRRLWLDTGSPHSLLLRTQPRPGDKRTAGIDLNGTEVPLYEGTGFLDLGRNARRQITLWRCPRWAGLEKRVNEMGLGIDGLLGLSALGMRKIVFQRDTGQVLLEQG